MHLYFIPSCCLENCSFGWFSWGQFLQTAPVIPNTETEKQKIFSPDPAWNSWHLQLKWPVPAWWHSHREHNQLPRDYVQAVKHLSQKVHQGTPGTRKSIVDFISLLLLALDWTLGWGQSSAPYPCKRWHRCFHDPQLRFLLDALIQTTSRIQTHWSRSSLPTKPSRNAGSRKGLRR